MNEHASFVGGRPDIEYVDIAARMRAEVQGKNHRRLFRRYANTFTGKEAVAWMRRAGVASNEADALALGNQMIVRGFFGHVSGQFDFENKALRFYRWEGSQGQGDGGGGGDRPADAEASDLQHINETLVMLAKSQGDVDEDVAV